MLICDDICVCRPFLFLQSGARIFAKRCECRILYFYDFSVFDNCPAHNYYDNGFFKQVAFIEASQALVLVFLETTSLSAHYFICWCHILGDHSHMCCWHKQTWGQIQLSPGEHMTHSWSGRECWVCRGHPSLRVFSEGTEDSLLGPQSRDRLGEHLWCFEKCWYLGPWAHVILFLESEDSICRICILQTSGSKGRMDWPTIIFSRRLTQTL